jgi:hypothetical protein
MTSELAKTSPRSVVRMARFLSRVVDRAAVQEPRQRSSARRVALSGSPAPEDRQAGCRDIGCQDGGRRPCKRRAEW